MTKKLFLHLLEVQQKEFDALAVQYFESANLETVDSQRWVFNAKTEAYKDAARRIFMLRGLVDDS